MVRKNADGSISVGMLSEEKKTVESVVKTDSVEPEKPKKSKKSQSK